MPHIRSEKSEILDTIIRNQCIKSTQKSFAFISFPISDKDIRFRYRKPIRRADATLSPKGKPSHPIPFLPLFVVNHSFIMFLCFAGRLYL
jgi:hypothetical protein